MPGAPGRPEVFSYLNPYQVTFFAFVISTCGSLAAPSVLGW